MFEFQASVTCDNCGDSMEFDLPGLISVKNEAFAYAERAGWECNDQDLCPNCVSVGEWEDDDEVH